MRALRRAPDAAQAEVTPSHPVMRTGSSQLDRVDRADWEHNSRRMLRFAAVANCRRLSKMRSHRRHPPPPPPGKHPLNHSLAAGDQVAGLFVAEHHRIPQHVDIQQLPDVFLLVVICMRTKTRRVGALSTTSPTPGCGCAHKRPEVLCTCSGHALGQSIRQRVSGEWCRPCYVYSG